MSSLIYHRLKASGLCFSSRHPSCCSEIRESDQKGPVLYTHVGTRPSLLRERKHGGCDYGGSRLSLCVCDEDTPGFICKSRARSSWGRLNPRGKRGTAHAA